MIGRDLHRWERWIPPLTAADLLDDIGARMHLPPPQHQPEDEDDAPQPVDESPA